MKTTDQKVKELFDLVQTKKLAIEKAERPCWNTSGQFGFSASSAHDRVNIQTLTDVRKLVEMLAFLIDRKDKIEIASKELGAEDFISTGTALPSTINAPSMCPEI